MMNIRYQDKTISISENLAEKLLDVCTVFRQEIGNKLENEHWTWGAAVIRATKENIPFEIICGGSNGSEEFPGIEPYSDHILVDFEHEVFCIKLRKFDKPTNVEPLFPRYI